MINVRMSRLIKRLLTNLLAYQRLSVTIFSAFEANSGKYCILHAAPERQCNK
jgi:hypothetical protein